jgi:DNA-binding response OmpR family regulator
MLHGNFDLITASTIEAAFKLIQRENFQLYIFDSSLPDGSGLELVKKVRQFDLSTPIIFYSATTSDVDMKTAMNAGVQSYIVKPGFAEELNEDVQRLIRRDTARQGHRPAPQKPRTNNG